MKAETPADYRRVKTAALQQLAGAGDVAAAKELERRGLAFRPAVNVVTLDYHALRALVLAWNNGTMPSDRERSRDLALQAQAELEIRFRVDDKLWDGIGVAPQPPPLPPWKYPQQPRCADWKRPEWSKLYPKQA